MTATETQGTVMLESLLERVEKAEGHDPLLDWDIVCGVGLRESPKFRPYGLGHTANAASPVTGSLDAALALVEEKLPECNVVLNTDRHNKPQYRSKVFVGPAEKYDIPGPDGASFIGYPSFMAWAPTPALALIAALLQALIVQRTLPAPPEEDSP